MFINFTFIVISTLVSKIVSSSDFSLKGDACSKFDSCFAKPDLRTCSCDNDCQLYGTCCHDFHKHRKDLPKDTYSCYSRRTATPVFVKRSCSDDFLGHIDNNLACVDDDEDVMDVKNNLLVTSHKTKITYWNKFCAKCSNELEEDLELWNIEVFCPQHEKVDRRLIRRNLTFDQDTMQWGLEIDGEFLQCIVKYAPPPYIDEVKPCSLNLISSCPENYTNEEIATTCSKYYAERKLKNSDIYYKNVHCAICNGVDVINLECPGMYKPEDNVEETDFRDMVEEIFTQGSWLDQDLTKSFECSKGFSYDPVRTKCRRDPSLIKVVSPIFNSCSILRTNVLTAIVMFLFFMIV